MMPEPETITNDTLLAENYKLAPPPEKHRRWRIVFPSVLLFLALIVMYYDGLVWLLKVWSGNAYSHGYLVPLISLFLVWDQRERFRLSPIAPSYTAAAAFIFVSMGLLLISRGSAFIQLESASLFLIIPGVLLLLFGRQLTRAALLPWLYLSFALPWFDFFLDHLQPPFQRITAILGTGLLRLIYPVHLNETYIFLPSITLEVVKSCSGVAFLISVLAIGVPLVYLTQRSWNRVTLVLGLGVIITILANGFRVAMAGIMGENFGPEMLHGPAHIFQGWFVAWIGWGGIFLVNWLVYKHFDPLPAPIFSERWKMRPLPNQQDRPVTRISPRQIYLTFTVLALCVAVIFFASPRTIPLLTLQTDIPSQLHNWTGAEEEWLGQESLFPGADAQLSRSYRSTHNATPVYLHIAYFTKQTEQKRMVSQFSRPLHKKAVEILHPSIVPKKVNLTTMNLNGIIYDVAFWYQFPGGETVTDRNQARRTALKNGIIHRYNNGAVVLIAARHAPQTNQKADSVPPSITSFLKSFDSSFSGLLP